VAFVLKVVSGSDKGSEYPFDGGEAKLGRTADNDVVIKDASASRSHARVFEKGGKFFLEDVGSANGTKVNGAALKPKAPRELKPGDKISIGEWAFTLGAPPPPEEDEGEVGDDEVGPTDEANATMMKSVEEMEAMRAKALQKRPPTSSIKAQKVAPPPEPDATGDDGDEDDDRTTEGKIARLSGSSPVRRTGVSPAIAAPAAAPMTAAERARQRRELSKSASGKAQLIWQDLPRPAQLGLMGVGGLMVLGVLGFFISVMVQSGPQKKKEPGTLTPNSAPIAESFGSGDGVYFNRRSDMKTFTFTTASPTQVVGVLHYQAKNISKDEVTISLNGTELGSIAPDNIDPESRELDVVLPAADIKAREDNTLIFDNVQNPPGSEDWQIWNVWLEIIPVPELSPDQADARAKDEIARAQKFYDNKGVGAESLFKSWKTYREAWLLLEATPNRNEALHQIARTRMREIRPELDAVCSRMLVEYKKIMNQRPQDLVKAKAQLQDIFRYFPTREHPCFTFARDAIRDIDDLGDKEYTGRPPPQ
jgi:pSer/pThr/pTyr-binding forkhead associated (FHA) protein